MTDPTLARIEDHLVALLDVAREIRDALNTQHGPTVIQPPPMPEPREWWQSPVTCSTTTDEWVPDGDEDGLIGWQNPTTGQYTHLIAEPDADEYRPCSEGRGGEAWPT